MFATMFFLQAVLSVPAAGAPVALPAQTTLPVVFSHTVSSKTVHAGEIVQARTTATVRLNGRSIPAGALVTGHVLEAEPFIFDRTPYAHQKPGVLAISFDAVDDWGTAIPLHATLRAQADHLASWDTAKPLATDIDPDHTTTQVGGDQVVPWQKPVRSSSGDVVGYLHGGFVYAHLIAGDGCNGSYTEQAMGIFSASACGLYGMPDDAFRNSIGGDGAPTIVLSSTRHTPEIHAHSNALLEEVVMPTQSASR